MLDEKTLGCIDNVLYAGSAMGATSVTFLSTDGDQISSRRDIREVPVRVFFSDKKDKPAEAERYEIRRKEGVERGNTCLVPTECWS